MKAIVLAAGRGERMRPLTDTTPKPLLVVRGKPLIAWHLEALARAGVRQVVVNTAWLEERIVDALGDGRAFGLAIVYSCEGRDWGGALETAGGIRTALPLLDLAPGEWFWSVSADVFMPDFGFDAPADDPRLLGRLWLVPNPPHHPEGDFGIGPDGLATTAAPRRTWSGIGRFRREFVTEFMADLPVGRAAKLRPYLDAAIAAGRFGATGWAGSWTDVGTSERLAALNAAQGL
jgi:MurNAc alpha-1-phosphate uridylyltransferase